MGVVNSACGGCFGETQKPSKLSPDIPETLRNKPKKSDSTLEDFDKEEECCKRQDDCVSADHCLKRKSTADEKYRPTLSDFHLIKILGQGSFGKVCLVQKKSNKKYYALKGLKKKDLVLENLLKNALTERNILKEIQHPFIVQLKYAFQSKSRVYMVMDFCTGGDLCSRMKKEEKFDEKTVRFYAAEIVLALEYLHETLNTIHRDIKPENILISSDGHVKLTDFGVAKARTKALTFCGTLYYVAPEIISGQPYGQEVDWWSLGCLMYEMLTGSTAFGQGGHDLADSILEDEPDMSHKFSDSLRDLLTRLMTKDPKQRLGVKGAQQIKEHSFFEGINWEDVLKKKLTPPFRVAFTKQEISAHPDMGFGLESMRLDDNRQHGEHVDLPQFAYVAKDEMDDSLDLQTK